MGLASGLDTQFGMVAEVTYGTFVTPTRFYELAKAPKIDPDVQHIMVRGLGRGRTQRSAQVRAFQGNPSVETPVYVMDRSMGLLLKHCFGAVSTSGAGDPYTHTITKGTTGTKGLFATVQIGVPDISGTVRPYNFVGAKVTKFGMECKVGDPLLLTPTWDAKAFEDTSALASKSYASGAIPLIFVDGAATIDGSSVSIKGFKLDVDQGLKVDRRFIGNAKKEPLPGDELGITGSLDFEFESLARTDDLLAGTIIQDLSLAFTYGSHSLVIAIPEMIYTEGAGDIQESDATQQPMSWKATDDGSAEIMTLTYLSPDSTP